MENCFVTQTKRQIQAQQIQKQTIKTTKPITLPPFSTTIVHGHTKLKGHGLKLNLIAEPFKDSQLPSNIQCTPTYCTLEPGSNRLTVGLRNISARKIIVPSKTIVCQIQLANMIPLIQTSKEQPPTERKMEDHSCILDQLDLGEINTWSEEQQQAARKLLCDYSETFSKNDLDLGKCNILKHNIQLTDQGPNFESELIANLCEVAGVQKLRTSPYHPQTNGQCERFNSTLLNMLGTLTPEQKKDWKTNVPTMVHAYNCTRNTATGYSPYYLMFGREPRLPIDVEFGLKRGNQQGPPSKSNYET